jgi:hypothetical protein
MKKQVKEKSNNIKIEFQGNFLNRLFEFFQFNIEKCIFIV